MTNGFALNHAKRLQIYFFCEKSPAKQGLFPDRTAPLNLRYQILKTLT